MKQTIKKFTTHIVNKQPIDDFYDVKLKTIYEFKLVIVYVYG